jgi:galactosylceramidase
MSRLPGCGSIVFLLLLQIAIGRAETVTLDGRTPGRTFEGIGGLSAGAGTRLLFDYPEPQRSQVLDFLFKPNFGAALQHLKVEIGGDVNSTEGTEPSHARTREEFEHPRPEYFQRGYEWWLMREAKRRNPRIYLDVLQWGAPAWIGDRDVPDHGDPNALGWPERAPRNRQKFYTQDNANFVASFIRGAKQYHGLEINYCGIWNETLHDSAWIKLLRKTLDAHGLAAVEIIGCDDYEEGGRGGWRIVDEFAKDTELKRAIGAVGVHYPNSQSTPAARQCGKPLWSSEDNPQWKGPDWHSGLATAKMYNRNYIDGRMTKTITCYLLDSYYDALAWADNAPMKANAPWSGHYEVWPTIWAMAHTSQFAQPGWQYLDAACRLLEHGGSCVALRDPKAGGDYSIIIETTDAKTPQTVSFRIAGGLAAGPVHVWRSSAQSQFAQQADIAPADGSFTVRLEPGCIYSLTTTTGQHKGQAEIPAPAPFPCPYRDDFEGYAADKMAKYFSDQAGVFEVAERGDGGKCLRQTVARRGIDWHYYPNPDPYTILGDAAWRDGEVACDVSVERAGEVAIFGRIAKSVQDVAHPQPPYGYGLKASTDGRWELKAHAKTLASGRVPFAADRWHHLALRFDGPRITALIDGAEVKSIRDETFRAGMAGLGSGWNNARYDNFCVRPSSCKDTKPTKQ